jgi:hypothetical protein
MPWWRILSVTLDVFMECARLHPLRATSGDIRALTDDGKDLLDQLRSSQTTAKVN